MKAPLALRRPSERAGIAMVAVLLVLMALFVLCAPFLITVRNADQASGELAERATLRVALDSAARHGRARLSASHPGLDETPTYDDVAELSVRNRFAPGFLRADDPHDVMWDLDVTDVAGRVDLGSASPQVLANLFGGVARATEMVTKEATSLQVSSADGFLDQGVLWMEGELIAYAERSESSFSKLTRGLGAAAVEGVEEPCGPQPASGHELGAYAIDQRAFAIAQWRIATGELRAFDGIERVREAAQFAGAGELGRAAYLALERSASPHGGVRAGPEWQHAARLLAVEGQPDHGCTLTLDDMRWFNPGTTVCVSDGRATEYAMVRKADARVLVLDRVLQHRFEPRDTIVQALARRPVNVNTAGPEVLRALWLNLKLRSKSARITAGEADQLVELVRASRPFTGFEDFLRRIVLPAGGLAELPGDAPVPEMLAELAEQKKVDDKGTVKLQGFLDREDAIAVYKNALNANDNELEFGTMPLCFTARDVYQLELRASVNAPSGIERAAGTRELVELVVPQDDLLEVWTRQWDFDLAPRLDQEGAGWLTGPRPTSRYDPLYGPTSSLRWPTRARANMGPHDTMPSIDPLGEGADEYVFATETEEGWAQLAPAREEDNARRATYALHFDDETRELEGRFLPDGPEALDLARLGWSSSGMMDGMAMSLWIKPRELEDGAELLDVGGNFSDADSVQLLFEGGDLVLRVRDGMGDLTDTTFKEVSEVRHPLGEGPGLPLDTWSHVQITVDGSRPDQMGLWVDGRRAEKTPGLTRLASSITGQADTIPVESTEGFPDLCVLRIGDELIEVFKDGEKSFRARFQSMGERAGFGGRLAREQFTGAEPNEQSQGLFKDTGHPAGTTVQLYGYSLPLFRDAPPSGGTLAGELGRFAVARVSGIVKGGSEKVGALMEPIDVAGFNVPLGFGMDGAGNDVEALVLAPADPNMSPEDTMAAFDPRGGYAAIVATDGSGWSGPAGAIVNDIRGTRVQGLEVIRYGRVDGNHLVIDLRGDAVNLKRMAGAPASMTGRGSFVFFWNEDDLDFAGHTDLNQELAWQVMVVPISVAVDGAAPGDLIFENPDPTSRFAQITHLGGESQLTEWVRYDEVAPGQLVRDDPDALEVLFDACHPGAVSSTVDPTRPTGGGPGPGTPPRRMMAALEAPAVPRATAPGATVRRATAQQTGGSSDWFYWIGEAEDADFVVSRAVRSQFQFRGVFGTYPHAHTAGTAVLPTMLLTDRDETAGWPGRFDQVMFFNEQVPGEPASPGFPEIVHHAHRPSDYTLYEWTDTGALTAAAGAISSAPQKNILGGVTYVGLESELTNIFPASALSANAAAQDTRLLARMSLFPSGELPRFVQDAQLGGGAGGGGIVPSAVVDEALFFRNSFGGVSGIPGQLVLAQPLGESDQTMTLAKDIVRTPMGDQGSTANVLAQLPEHGGLLRMGDEILCYDSYDSGTFVFTLPPGGRGLLGTEPQAHRVGEGLSPLASLPCAVLGAGVGADTADLPLLEFPVGFPGQGLVWLDGELVHYTSHEDNVLTMPRASLEPGAMDHKGPGLFRGRFGTARSGHDTGTPVILFPFRYWDCWSDLADAPELTYFQLTCDQPDAFWKRVFWKEGVPPASGAQMLVLQRTDASVPWDALPGETKGLTLLEQGKLDGDGNPIGVQADRIEWRVFVRHAPGSFDPDQGLAHGWKATPRLELFGVEYIGPGRTLERVDR